MFYVTSERFEIKTNVFDIWDSNEIIEAYQSEEYNHEDIVFESDSYQQAKKFFEHEKSDCKTFYDSFYLKADIIALYYNEELMEIYASPLKRI